LAEFAAGEFAHDALHMQHADDVVEIPLIDR